MSGIKNKVITIAIIATVIAGLYYIMIPAPVPVDTATISTGPLAVTVNEEGVTRIKEIYRVSAPIAGLMLRSPREIGDKVEKGKSLIATIKPTDPSFLDKRTRAAAQAAVNSAEAGVKLAQAHQNRAQAEVTYARQDLERSRKLSRKQAISKKTLEQAELRMKTQQALLQTTIAELEVRKQEYIRAKAHLIEPKARVEQQSGPCCIEVLAPVSGQVLKILTESETVVISGTNIVEIGNPADLEISVDMLSSDAVRIKVGAPVVIENWGGNQKLNGRILKIEPSGFMKVSALGIEEQRVKAQIEITSPESEWEKLGHNYRVFVRITVWKQNKVLRIPLSALFRKKQSWAVFKVENNTAVLKEIKIGQRNNEFAQIIDGLAEGDQVVLHPGERLTTGHTIVRRTSLK